MGLWQIPNNLINYETCPQQLQRIYQDCVAANTPFHLVVDRGHVQLPHFDGNPIYTCIGIGPVYKDEIEHITKRYSLIK